MQPVNWIRKSADVDSGIQERGAYMPPFFDLYTCHYLHVPRQLQILLGSDSVISRQAAVIAAELTFVAPVATDVPASIGCC